MARRNVELIEQHRQLPALARTRPYGQVVAIWSTKT